MNNWSIFIGRFHPLLVHLPIGILFLAVLFQWLSVKPKFSTLKPVLPYVWLFGAAGALFSCITGYLLSGSGGYDEGILSLHQWLGIATALFSIAGYFLCRTERFNRSTSITAIAVFLLLMATGHYGGSLTHGSDYLTEALPVFSTTAQVQGVASKKITDINEAIVYKDLVEPILKEKCFSCHNTEKKKGGLQLHTPEAMMLGGKNGPVIVAGQPTASELLKRILLPLTEKEHMAPKGKPQVTEKELALLTWWISSGASFTARVKELKADNSVAALLASQSSGGEEKEQKKNIADPDIPTAEIKPADAKSINTLSATGALLLPASRSGNYLTLNCVNAPEFGDEQVKLLAPLQQHLVSVSFANTKITDAGLKALEKMPNLTNLRLDQTGITDAGLKHLLALPALKYLNLNGTGISTAGLASLNQLKELRRVVVYRTAVQASDSSVLKKTFPNTRVELGGYVLPVFATDTTVVKEPKR